MILETSTKYEENPLLVSSVEFFYVASTCLFFFLYNYYSNIISVINYYMYVACVFFS